MSCSGETVTKLPEYTLRRVKTFRGMDGQGLNAELMRDGKVVAFVLDEGCGGEMRFDWMDRTHGKSSEEDAFRYFIDCQKAKLDDVKKDEFGLTERGYFDGAAWVNRTVDDMLNAKRFQRICRTHVVYQVGAEIGTDKFWKTKGGADMIVHIRQKYAGQKLRILNDEFKG